MNDRARRTLYLVAGMYVFYLGIKLIVGFANGAEGNPIVSLAGGILFLGAGGWLIVDYIIKTIRSVKAQDEKVTEDVEDVLEEALGQNSAETEEVEEEK